MDGCNSFMTAELSRDLLILSVATGSFEGFVPLTNDDCPEFLTDESFFSTGFWVLGIVHSPPNREPLWSVLLLVSDPDPDVHSLTSSEGLIGEDISCKISLASFQTSTSFSLNSRCTLFHKFFNLFN